ncbi:hypothetical protein HRJ45_12540 [Vibrio coralliilyticus]|uniref:hypothetical protein n=1 Tax=Vibrio coralliilyticus TaxID=190893 RepID=UPI00155FD28C|nr:hypothetical protein [Vibrio coralliilyticus]NRF25873.1 hypothetical protein [Vibrio coralliilyticus]NRF79938.1 hypothetical protein [Vibrio coralliilyticus]
MSIDSYISIITTIVTIVLFFGGYFLWQYKKQPSLKLTCNIQGQSMVVTARNHKDAVSVIKHVKLVRKRKLSFSYDYDPSSFHALVDNEKLDFHSTQNDSLNMSLKVGGDVLELIIPFAKVSDLYGYFLPYQYCKSGYPYLEKVTKMPKCFIVIELTSGKAKFLALPKSFYSYYREKIGAEWNRDINIFLGKHPKISLHFSSDSERIEHSRFLSERYASSRQLYHYLVES